MLGIDPFTSQTYKTAVGSDPSEVSVLHIWGSDLAAPASSLIVGDIEITYTVLWTELATPTQS